MDSLSFSLKLLNVLRSMLGFLYKWKIVRKKQSEREINQKLDFFHLIWIRNFKSCFHFVTNYDIIKYKFVLIFSKYTRTWGQFMRVVTKYIQILDNTVFFKYIGDSNWERCNTWNTCFAKQAIFDTIRMVVWRSFRYINNNFLVLTNKI